MKQQNEWVTNEEILRYLDITGEVIPSHPLEQTELAKRIAINTGKSVRTRSGMSVHPPNIPNINPVEDRIVNAGYITGYIIFGIIILIITLSCLTLLLAYLTPK